MANPTLKSWVPVAPESDFPIQNLPFGIFRAKNESPRVGVAIGDQVLDLWALEAEGFFEDTTIHGKDIFARDSLNDFLEMGRPAWTQVRNRVSSLLESENSSLRDNAKLR